MQPLESQTCIAFDSPPLQQKIQKDPKVTAEILVREGNLFRLLEDKRALQAFVCIATPSLARRIWECGHRPPYSNAKEVLDTRGHLRIRSRVRALGCVGFPMLSVYQAASFENYFSG